jgi:hypothetical protein
MHKENKYKIFSNELNEFDQFLSHTKENSTRFIIIYLELLSVLFTIVFCILSGVLSFKNQNHTSFAISIDSFMDILFYSIVVWRYFKQIDCESNEDRFVIKWLSIIFLVSSFLIGFESISSILLIQKPIASKSLILISIIQSIVFTSFSVLKFYLAKNLINNQVMISSGNI